MDNLKIASGELIVDGGTTPSTPTDNPSDSKELAGDANLDGKVSISDAVAILQHLANSTKYPLDETAKKNADVYNRGDGVTGNDAASIQRYDAGVVTALPESVQS